MKILISGSSGLIGSAVCAHLTQQGHTVIRLLRTGHNLPSDAVHWDIERNVIHDSDNIRNTEAILHLGGETVVGRWTDAKKARIRDSRVRSTRALAERAAGMDPRPQVFLSASAVGYYGDRGDETLDESSSGGDGFLAGVCRDWEEAVQPAVDAGIRTTPLRLGMIVSRHGGGLKEMLLPFRLCLGGRMGSGKQYMSWIDIQDVCRAIDYLLRADRLSGPVNLTAPEPVTNIAFTRALGRVIRRPTPFPVPAFAARLLFGELADAMLLASQRVVPARLLEAGFTFDFPDVDASLRHHLPQARTLVSSRRDSL